MKTNTIKKSTTAILLISLFTLTFTSCSDDLVEDTPNPMLTKAKLGEDRTKSEFLTNWENCSTVEIAGIDNEIYCPWYGAAAQNIPDYVRFDTKKEMGWEMAFCELNDPNASSTRMFGLYNRYTGILRVFHYIEDATGYGSELVYLVAGSETVTDDRYPLYHSMEYGIPSNHEYGSTLVPYAKLSSGETTQDAFSCYVAPYTKENARGVTVNWHCFDIDLSGYLPEGKDWRQGMAHRAQLTIFPITKTSSEITLTGSLIGSIEGSFTDPQIIETGGGNSMSGVCSTLNTISSLLGGSVSSSNIMFNMMNNKNIPSGISSAVPYLSVASMGLNITSAILGWAGGESPVTRDTIPGKIDLGLNASINLQGVISGYTSHAMGGLSIPPELLAAGNADGNTGKGVWGLAADPVVYVSKEDLLSSVDHFNLVADGSNYTNSEFYDYDVRLVSFFDPSSVQVNLNTDLFHNIKDLVVTTNYGVYTNYNMGHSDSYRKFLKLDDRQTINIGGGKTSGVVRLSSNSTPRIHQVDINDLIVDGYELAGDKTSMPSSEETEMGEQDICTYLQLPGSNVNVYGRHISLVGKEMVMMPQVFVPFEKGGAIYDPVVPDFLVTVTITFKCDEGCMQYSKTFVPEIRLIGHDDLGTKYDQLKAYSDLCGQEQPVGKLANNSSISVYDKHSDLFLRRTLKMLEKVK